MPQACFDQHERPFTGSSPIAVADAILHAKLRDFGETQVPGPLKSLIRKLLEKEPANRYGSAQEVLMELKAVEASLAPARRAQLSRGSWIAAVVVMAVVIGMAAWFRHRSSRERWALQTAAPEIARLVDAGEYVKAAALTGGRLGNYDRKKSRSSGTWRSHRPPVMGPARIYRSAGETTHVLKIRPQGEFELCQ